MRVGFGPRHWIGPAADSSGPSGTKQLTPLKTAGCFLFWTLGEASRAAPAQRNLSTPIGQFLCSQTWCRKGRKRAGGADQNRTTVQTPRRHSWSKRKAPRAPAAWPHSGFPAIWPRAGAAQEAGGSEAGGCVALKRPPQALKRAASLPAPSAKGGA